MSAPPPVPRSYLYVPAHQAQRLTGALDRGADAVIADLEDGVALADKPSARAATRVWLEAAEPSPVQRWVRINADDAATDLIAVLAPALRGVVVPKSEPARLAEIDALLTDREQVLGLPVGHCQIVATIETARGVLTAPELAGVARVVRLGIGEADLSAELGVTPGPARTELDPIRLGLVVASAAAGLAGPIAPVATDFRDLHGLATSTARLRALGFRARTAIHPSQLPVINQAFTPTEAELAQARRLVGLFDASPSGVVVDERGHMIDEAVVRAARNLLR